jgi:antitoxin VapB
MGIFIKDAATDKAIRKLAKLRGTTLTEAIRTAVLKSLSEDSAADEDAALKKIQDRFASYPPTGLKADKAFFDSLYED